MSGASPVVRARSVSARGKHVDVMRSVSFWITTGALVVLIGGCPLPQQTSAQDETALGDAERVASDVDETSGAPPANPAADDFPADPEPTTPEPDSSDDLSDDAIALLGDCDRDGLSDLQEILAGTPICDARDGSDVDADGLANENDDDIDGDGLPNAADDDVDGDGLLNGEDPDVDGDGVLNGDDVDVDGDFFRNRWDFDIDGEIEDGVDADEARAAAQLVESEQQSGG